MTWKLDAVTAAAETETRDTVLQHRSSFSLRPREGTLHSNEWRVWYHCGWRVKSQFSNTCLFWKKRDVWYMSVVPRCTVLYWDELSILNVSKHIKCKDILQSSQVRIKHIYIHTFRHWKLYHLFSSMYLSFPLKGPHIQMSYLSLMLRLQTGLS